jgi:acyl carrier protein
MPDERTITVVYRAVDEVNQTLPATRQVKQSLDSPLREPAGTLDSMGLVNLIVALEEQVEMEYGVTVNLADQRSVDESIDPLSSVERLVAYLERLLAKRNHA